MEVVVEVVVVVVVVEVVVEVVIDRSTKDEDLKTVEAAVQ